MTYDEVLAQVVELLQRDKRVAYRVLKRRFGLDDEYVYDLKADLIKAKRLALDEDGEVLVWVGDHNLESRVQSPEPEGKGQTSSVQTLAPRLKDSRFDAPERRQLTVMFCDLVGSTALSAQLDPEEWRDVVQAYQAVSATVISRYAGYPVAHEDDAARAVRIGLEIVETVRKKVPSPLLGDRVLRVSEGGQGEGVLGSFRSLQVRISIHTGLVVVGEMGGGEKRELLALGEAPNIAARVQGEAEPNTVVMSAATALLARDQSSDKEKAQELLNAALRTARELGMRALEERITTDKVA